MAAADDALNAFMQAMQSRQPTKYELPEGMAADAAYLAFLRGAGVAEDDAWAATATQLQNLHRQYLSAGETVRTQGDQARDAIAKEHMMRNTTRSGERLDDLARQRALEERTLADLDVEFANRMAETQQGLNSRLAELMRQHQEQVGQLAARAEERKQQERVQFAQMVATWTPQQWDDWHRFIGVPTPPPPAYIVANAQGGGGGGGGMAMPQLAPYLPAQPKTDAEIMRELYEAGVRGPQQPKTDAEIMRELYEAGVRGPQQPRTLAGYQVSYGQPTRTLKPAGLR